MAKRVKMREYLQELSNKTDILLSSKISDHMKQIILIEILKEIIKTLDIALPIEVEHD